jgi:nucleotide-binding universal stress UspA family protein
MATDIIVSYDGTANDHDALALGRLLTGAGGSLSLAYVRHTRESERRQEELAQHEAEALLDDGATWLERPAIPRHVVLSGSTPEGLRDLAEREKAQVIVFGSEYRTAPGHVDPQNSARRLLDGGPLAVAIAPAGLHAQGVGRIETIAAVPGELDASATETAEWLATTLGATLVERPRAPVSLLVVGSKRGTPSGRVTISAAAEYLIETGTSPVLVVPRGTAIRFGAP